MGPLGPIDATASDRDLVEAARGGDREAFGTLYDRYADRIHDFCTSVLRDRDEAADATQDTFVIASRRLDQLRDPSKVRPWLYAIARHEAIRRGKARARARPIEDAGADEAATAAGPEDVVSRDDAVAIVWDAAAGLNERDRALLDLHVRQGLSGQDLAHAMGVRPNTASMAVNRLKAQVERAMGALLVARLGHRDCTELQGVLAGWDGTFSPLVRKRVARHVDGCDVCSENRTRFTSPLALLASVPAVPAPAALRDRVLAQIDLTATSGPPGGETEPRVDRHGFPTGSGPAVWKQVVAAVAVGGLVGAGAVVGVDRITGDETPPRTRAPVTTPPAPVDSAPPPRPEQSVEATGEFTSFPGELPGDITANRVDLAFPLDGGRVTGESVWSSTHPAGEIVHEYSWSGRFDASTRAMSGEVDVTFTNADGSVNRGRVTWMGTYDAGSGVVTGNVALDDGDDLAFRVRVR